MTSKEEYLITKFLETHYGDLEEKDLIDGKYKTLSKKTSKENIFLLEFKHEQVFVNTKKVIDPILKIFNTDYTETYSFVKKWLSEKYKIDCIDLIGLNPD